MTKLAPGLHPDVPIGVYLADCCPGPSVSGSELIRMDQTCPAVAYAHWTGNPDRLDHEGTAATKLGSALHTLVLEGEPVFRKRYAVKPEGMSLATTDGKAWRRDQSGKEILSSDDGMAVFAMSRALSRDPVASKAFEDGIPEATAVMKDPITGLYLRCRPDWLRTSVDLALNLKTALSAKPDEWRRQAFELGYFVSAAVTVDVLSAVRDRPFAEAFVIVEKSPPYPCVVCTLSAELIEFGRLIYRKALQRYADCIASGAWPGYSDKVIEVDMPPWAKYRLEEREAAGEFETRQPETLTEMG